jgi:hypothetical protein
MDCLVKRSTITRIAVNSEDGGNCSMKSIEMEFQGVLGTGNCLSRPYGLWRCGLLCMQVMQDLQYSLTKDLMPGQS